MSFNSNPDPDLVIDRLLSRIALQAKEIAYLEAALIGAQPTSPTEDGGTNDLQGDGNDQ